MWQRLDQRGMHGYQWIEEVGEVDAVGLGGEAKGGTMCIKAPRKAFGGDLDAWFTLAIEQYAVKVSVSSLIG